MKLIRKLKLLGAISFIALLSFSFTQTEVNEQDGWTLLSTTSEVKSYVLQYECGNQNLFLFKFENTSDSQLNITYTITVTDDPTFPPITKSLDLKGSAISQGTCDDLWTLALPNTIESKKDIKDQVSVYLTINR